MRLASPVSTEHAFSQTEAPALEDDDVQADASSGNPLVKKGS